MIRDRRSLALAIIARKRHEIYSALAMMPHTGNLKMQLPLTQHIVEVPARMLRKILSAQLQEIDTALRSESLAPNDTRRLFGGYPVAWVDSQKNLWPMCIKVLDGELLQQSVKTNRR